MKHSARFFRALFPALAAALAAAAAADSAAAQMPPIGKSYHGPGGGGFGCPHPQQPRKDPSGSYRGPGDSRPEPAGGALGESPGASGGPSSPARPGSAARPPASAAGPSVLRAALTSPVGPEAWWTWWQLHKSDFLRANLLRHWVAVVSGYGSDDGMGGLDALRAELLPGLRSALRAADPQVRAAAAIALGRLARGAAVAELLPLLEDPGVEVRERAILALGATGAQEAGRLLLEIARTGRHDGRRGRSLTSDARPLAVFALAIGRRNGLGEEVDGEVAQLARTAEDRATGELRASILLYQTLNASPELADWTLERATDDSAPTLVRSRALETLRTRADDRALVVLVETLTEGDVELRRSAALALGEFEHPLALSRLMAALAEEREPLTRGFVMISIGRRGGAEARECLVRELAEGPKATRAWCALALGILARDGHDEAAREALRAGLERERSQHTAGAFHLALGIARDGQAVELLTRAMGRGATPESRAVAAMGLAMIGDERGVRAMQARFLAEPNPVTRAEIAQALGYVGDAADVPHLLAALADPQQRDLRISAAAALGLHGTRAGLEGLIALAADTEATPAVRAAALEAMQVVLGQQPSLTVSELLRQSNFSVFPPALIRLMQVPL